MPPRPFPFPLRVGTDICSIKRIQTLLCSHQSPQRRLERFLPKLLTWPERQYFRSRFPSSHLRDNNLNGVSVFLAGRWAAKEACRKACEHLGTSNGFHSTIILPITAPGNDLDRETTRPRGLILRERLPERTFVRSELDDAPGTWGDMVFDIDSVESQFCEVSISHDNDWATAVAIVPVLDWQHKT
ncbi:hypothetical protein P280DRAFT_433251 [Massarina eburnea CBS 473.64]|uniref:4'-phosphopantetheinyl transferase domain-containing protein n=1 Tax=Massarina eburnea CBS 473.64 TaxID=1395130 RepID=A0A6A6RTD3_9PLEO|nr:hypothetical protein P280DRAFT_433251 [Massarina eburnea CBS 473.64]